MINAALVRWGGGWHEVTDSTSIATYGRHEGLLGLGATKSLAEVGAVTARMLTIWADPREEISAGVWPQTDAERPYLGFRVGDTITVPGITGTPTAERVVALTVSEDDNGVVTYAPEMKDVLFARAERYEQALKKMVDGTVAGQAKAATPVANVGVNDNPACCPIVPPPWHIRSAGDAPYWVTMSELWTADITTTMRELTVSGELMLPREHGVIRIMHDAGAGATVAAEVDLLTANPATATLNETVAVGDSVWMAFAPGGTTQIINGLVTIVECTGQHVDVNLGWPSGS